MVRRQSGKDESPSLGLIDSRNVKTSCNGGESCGIDGGKKTKDRKQHIITDTLGLILVVVIHAANIHDSKVAIDVISNFADKICRDFSFFNESNSVKVLTPHKEIKGEP